MMPARVRGVRTFKRCRGVILLTVVFVMVVLGLLAALLAGSLGGQFAVSNLAQLARQAEYAAASGVEWGRKRAVQGGVCASSQIAIAEFTIDVSCTTVQVTEGAADYDVFRIDAVARHGTYGNPDFVSRRMSGRFSNR